MGTNLSSLCALFLLFPGFAQAHPLPVPDIISTQYTSSEDDQNQDGLDSSQAGMDDEALLELAAIPDPNVRHVAWYFAFKELRDRGAINDDQLRGLKTCFYHQRSVRPCLAAVGICKVGPVPADRLPVNSLLVYDNPFLILIKIGPGQLSGRVPQFATLITSWARCR